MNRTFLTGALTLSCSLAALACSGGKTTGSISTGGSGGSAGGGNSGGASGSAGSGGSDAGTGGSGGTAGVAGSSGSGGTGGVAGSSGSGGTGGVAGSGGTGGTAGSGGVGGTTGTGGLGGDGPGTNLRCAAGATVAVGDKPLIDNFDDGDLVIIHPPTGTEDGRAGEATLYNGNDFTAKIEAAEQALHFVADPSMQWPAFGIPIANCYDASAYTGISFKIKGIARGPDGKDLANSIRFSIATPVSTPEPAGSCPCPDVGVCAQCYDSFGFFLAEALNPTEYQTVTLPWSALKQGGWGNIAPPDYQPEKELLELDWGLGVNTGHFDIYIDDIAFTQ